MLDGVDAVEHLISTSLPKNSNESPIYDVETNLVATMRLLSLMVQRQIRKIVYASSGGTVYGIPRSIPVREDHPTHLPGRNFDVPVSVLDITLARSELKWSPAMGSPKACG